MSTTRNAVASARRDQVIDAATAVIVEQGIQNLSLSEVEKRAGMARGHLTYYFPTKEDILLAVFDRVLQRMHASVDGPHEGGCPGAAAGGWELTGMLLRMMLSRPLPNPEFGCLQHTFLAQAGHREDFRKKLAELYEFWRGDLAAKLEADVEKGTLRRCPRPRAVSTLIQALLHGLAVQSVADPDAFDTEEVLELCLDVLGTYLGARDGGKPAAAPPAPAARRRDRAAQRGEP
jgi:AcrR family transcriptional regulator